MIASIHELFKAFSGGQFEPVYTGQFESVRGGQFKSVGGGQFHRFLQKYLKFYFMLTSTIWITKLHFGTVSMIITPLKKSILKIYSHH